MEVVCILKCIDEHADLPVCVAPKEPPLLRLVDDAVSQGMVHRGICHNTGPQLVQSIGQPNGPVVCEVEWVIFLEK